MKITEALRYEPESGVFTWNIVSGSARPGNVAGKTGLNGYIRIGFRGKAYLAHRLAFLFMSGSIPNRSSQVDHVDGDRANNRWDNLRLCSAGENQQNRIVSKNNKCGLTGVSFHKGRWRAQIKLRGVILNIGRFDTAEIAHQAYLNKKLEIHKFNPIPRECQ